MDGWMDEHDQCDWKRVTGAWRREHASNTCKAKWM